MHPHWQNDNKTLKWKPSWAHIRHFAVHLILIWTCASWKWILVSCLWLKCVCVLIALSLMSALCLAVCFFVGVSTYHCKLKTEQRIKLYGCPFCFCFFLKEWHKTSSTGRRHLVSRHSSSVGLSLQTVRPPRFYFWLKFPWTGSSSRPPVPSPHRTRPPSPPPGPLCSRPESSAPSRTFSPGWSGPSSVWCPGSSAGSPGCRPGWSPARFWCTGLAWRRTARSPPCPGSPARTERSPPRSPSCRNPLSSGRISLWRTPSRTGRSMRISRPLRTREPLLCTLSWFPKQPTLLLPLRCEPASRPAGFQTARRCASASTFVRAPVGWYGAWPSAIAVLGVNTVVWDPRSAFVLWHVEFPTTAQPVLERASPVFVQVATVRPLLSLAGTSHPQRKRPHSCLSFQNKRATASHVRKSQFCYGFYS